MRVVVTGASGNVGTNVLAALAARDEVGSIVGISRRKPDIAFPRTTWHVADVARDDLTPVLRGADVVIHLAWLIQPSRDERTTYAVNVAGSRRVFAAAARAGVGALVHASSVGVYARAPKDVRVDERWPATGIDTSFYSRHKALAERDLDDVERRHPDLRVVRLRPGLVFSRDAAAEIRRLFLGPLFPGAIVRRSLVAVIPDVSGLKVQAVHGRDVGRAYAEAALRTDARGAFNIAAEPIVDARLAARVLGARTVPVPAAPVRGLASFTWHAHLQPTPPGWLDLALGAPIMSTDRAREVLGFTPAHSATDALSDLLGGLRDNAGAMTPPLAPGAGGPLRAREFLTGVGHR